MTIVIATTIMRMSVKNLMGGDSNKNKAKCDKYYNSDNNMVGGRKGKGFKNGRFRYYVKFQKN